MKISFTANGTTTELKAVGDGRWDSSPNNPAFILRSSPLNLQPDRIAVAATLLFGDNFGGIVDFGRPVNLVTAGGIQDYCSPVKVYPKQIDEGPKPIPAGSRNLNIFRGEWGGGLPAIENSLNESYLFLMDSSHFDGVISFQRGLAVSSNLWLHGQSVERSIAWHLAAGVLYAGMFDANLITVPQQVALDASSDYLRRAQNLLGTVGLGLQLKYTGAK